MPYWARKRLYCDYDFVMHNDWIIEDIQFGYKHREERTVDVTRTGEKRHIPESWSIIVRERKGLFGVSDWYEFDKLESFEELCRKLRSILEQFDNEKWKKWIQQFEQMLSEQEQKQLERKYCGFDPKGKVW